MNNKTTFKLFLLTFISIISLNSCNDDDDSISNDNGENSQLFDKWWYDSEDFAADIYFHSDGEYEQRIDLLGDELTGTGDWSWEDENEGILKIENLSGGGQVLLDVWFKITNLQESSMTLQQSLDGENYSQEVFFVDTDN